MAVTKKMRRKRSLTVATRHRRAPVVEEQPDILRAILHLADRLDGMIGALDRLGGLAERLLLARLAGADGSSDPTARPKLGPLYSPRPAIDSSSLRREETPGQGILPGLGARAKSASTPKTATATTTPRPSDFREVIAAARELVRGTPDREWTGADLCRALKDLGARPTSWRGMPMKLPAELKKQGVTEVTGGGRFRATQARNTVSVDRPPRAKHVPATPRRTDRGAQPPPAHALPWDTIVSAARRILEDDPTRRWKWAELARAVRENGVDSHSWKGVHIGLVAKLEALDLVERLDEHHFRARAALAPAGDDESEHTAAVIDSDPSGTDVRERGVDALEPQPVPGRVPEQARSSAVDSVFAVADEIKSLGSWLEDLPRRQCTAQIASWAGRLRRLHDSVGTLAPEEVRRLREEMRPLLGGLTRLSEQYGTEWIDALSSEWKTDDWSGYVTHHEAVAAGREPELTREREELFHRDRLRGLFNPQRRSAKRDAHEVLREALEVLPESDAVVVRVIQRFGRPVERRLEPQQPLPPFRRMGDRQATPQAPPPAVRNVPVDIRALTRGKRVLVAGGQGFREADRLAIEQKLELEKLDWVYGELGKGSHFQLLEERIRPGRYDMVLFLASHAGYNSSGLVEACRAAEVPLIYLSRGYSVTSVIESIRQQLLARRVHDGMAQR